MRIYYITSALFFALFFLGILLFNAARIDKKVTDFNIVDHIDEQSINGKLDVKRIINDAKALKNFFKTQGLSRHYWQQTLDFISRSGLDLSQTYYTYDLINQGPLTLYSTIDDPSAFSTALDEMKSVFNLKSNAEAPNRFYSKESNLQLVLGTRHIEVRMGKNAHKPDTVKPSISKHCAQLLKNGYTFIINPQGIPPLDSMDYITGQYKWDNMLNIQFNWHVKDQPHPFQVHTEKIHAYNPSEDALMNGFLNLNTNTWNQYDNSFLHKKMDALNRQPRANNLLTENWKGQLAFHYGGSTTQERFNITSDFDENFNRIQDTVIIRDTMKNAGIIIASESPETLYESISKQDYVDASSDKLQIALLPPFRHIHLDQKHLYLAASKQNFNRRLESRIAHLQFEDQQFRLSIEAKPVATNHVTINLEWEPHTSTIKASSFLRNFIQ